MNNSTEAVTKKRLSETSEWTFELLDTYHREIARIAADFGLDTYPNQIEVISAEQMMDAYSTVGMPVGYHHWSFGKQFLSVEQRYKRGFMGLAYEIVINSNPCIAYLMEENSMTMQALVIAHASYGHNSFFKNNYLFKTWTNADSIIDYLLFARNYVTKCEERYGVAEVEMLLDSCHVLMNYGVDRYKRPKKVSLDNEEKRQEEREEYLQSQVNDLWRTLPTDQQKSKSETEDPIWPSEPQENILYFIEKNSPILENWQREIVRIVRKIAQYFYPQRQTQVMNEGWATFWHYTIINRLYDEGLVTDGFMLEFLQSHTSVIYQPPFNSRYYSGLNPYTLGLNIYQDLKRMCESPTDEDREWFPDIAGGDWFTVIDFAMRNFKDESFISQYLSPKVIRDMKLFTILDDDQRNSLEVSAIHNERGYKHIRNALSEQYNLGSREPNMQVYKVNRRGDRSMTLRYDAHQQRPLNQETNDVLKHLVRLWGFSVRIESLNEGGQYELTHECNSSV